MLKSSTEDAIADSILRRKRNKIAQKAYYEEKYPIERGIKYDARRQFDKEKYIVKIGNKSNITTNF